MKKYFMKKDMTRKWAENTYQNACDEEVGINLSGKDKMVSRGTEQIAICQWKQQTAESVVLLSKRDVDSIRIRV